MDGNKLSKKIISATVIFILADISRLWGVFSNVSLEVIRLNSSIMSILEVCATFIMVGLMVDLAIKTSNRVYYIPMIFYFLYGLSYIYIAIGLTGWMYSHYGYDGYAYYKWFLLAAQIVLGIKLLLVKGNKSKKISGILIIVCSITWMVFIGISLKCTGISDEYCIISIASLVKMIFLVILSVVSHTLVMLCYGKVEIHKLTKVGKNKLWIPVVVIVIVALNIESYIEVRYSDTSAKSTSDVSGDTSNNTSNGTEGLICNSNFLDNDTRRLSERIEQYLNCNADKLSGTVLVSVKDEVIFKKAYGYADEINKIPNTTDEVCKIVLTTEQFTAAAIMQLVDEGVISLDDRLDKYVPEYVYADKITISQLLNMTSGIINYDYQTDRYTNLLSSMYGQDNISVEKNMEFRNLFIRMMNGYSLEFEPGTQYGFSRSDYYMLGLVIENATGMSYEDYVRTNILQKADMNTTYFDEKYKTTKAYYFGYVYGHEFSPSYTFSAAGILSTADDLLRWQKALISEGMVSDDSLKKILSNDDISGMGYGWTQEENGYRSFTTDYGYTICQYMNTDYNVNIVAMFNSSSGEAVNPVLDIEKYTVQYLQQKESMEGNE